MSTLFDPGGDAVAACRDLAGVTAIRSVDTPCVEWPGKRDRRGYGRLYRGGKVRFAHRLVVAEHLGWSAIEDRVVMHLCDNPPCVRFDHLAVASQAENLLDMRLKGRGQAPHLVGEEHGMHKLSTEQVLTIRRRYHDTVITLTDLAREYGVAIQTVHDVVKRKSWRHL